METKTGVLTEIIYHNEETGYTVAEMETEEELLTVVGSLPSAARGTCLEIIGTPKVHPKFGEQFAFTEATEKLPRSREGIEGFLASGVISGVGGKLAGAIVEAFGEDTFRIMAEDPRQLLKVPGIGAKKLECITESFLEHREYADVSGFFMSCGMTSAQALRLYKAFGREAADMIRENPYFLVDVLYGFGFRKADEIAMKMGMSADAPERIVCAIRSDLSANAAEGSTYMPMDELVEEVSQHLDLTRDQVGEQLTEMALEGSVKMDVLEDIRVVYYYSYFLAEQQVCAGIAALRNAELKELPVDIDRTIGFTEEVAGIPFSDQQKEAVKRSLTQGVSVITGGPGTGKTTIINAVINILKEGGLSVAIAAPTGRAAKRITEATGYFAQTVHRLLEYYYSEEKDGMSFGRNQMEPLEYDAVIVDEASMLDLLLFHGLLEAMRPGMRLILVGDCDQLPSVGAGNVLRDLIESGYVPVSALTRIYRQAQESMIVMNAHHINHGEPPVVNGRDTDFFFMDRGSEEEVQSLVVELVTKRLPAFFSDLDPLSDIQVLSPTKKGKAGIRELNQVLQGALNPPREDLPEKSHRGRIFRVGDKVMQIRNNYQLKWRVSGEGQSGEGVFNGDVGFIRGIDLEAGCLTVLFDEERWVEYEFTLLDELELAYAVTVHKSQGSEFPVVVMPVCWLPPMLATRNLLYTAVTRGKRAVVLVGDRRRMNAMVENDRIRLRYSGLGIRLERMMEFEG